MQGRITLSATKCFADYLLTALLHRWINSYQSLIKWYHKNFISRSPLFDFMRCTRPLSTNNPLLGRNINVPIFSNSSVITRWEHFMSEVVSMSRLLGVLAIREGQQDVIVASAFYLCWEADSCSSIHQATGNVYTFASDFLASHRQVVWISRLLQPV